jgi:hypothetical protein
MTKFKPLNNRLFQIDAEDIKSWVAYLFPKNQVIPKDDLSIDDSLKKYDGHYLFALSSPPIDNIQDFIDKIDQWISNYFDNPQTNPSGRTCIWLLSTNPLIIDDKKKCSFSFDEGSFSNFILRSDINIPIGSQIAFSILQGTEIKVTDRGLSFKSQSIGFTTEPITKGPKIEDLTDDYSILLPFTGNFSGCFILTGNIPPYALEYLKTGVAYSYSNNQTIVTNNYPVVDYQNITDPVKFIGAVDPLAPTNNSVISLKDGLLRTLLVPTDKKGVAASIKCLLSSSYGNNLCISSIATVDTNYETSPEAGAFVFESYNKNNKKVYLTCAGKFKIIKNEKCKSNDILCGLSGTESIIFPNDNNDTLRFFIKKPAFAPNFPLPELSPVGPPPGTDDLLTDDSKTSWLTINCEGGFPHYVSQPEGGNLYGKGSSNDLLIHKDVGLTLPSDPDFCIPLIAYSDCITNNEASIDYNKIQLFEQQIVSASRRRQITKANPQYSPSADASFSGIISSLGDTTFNTTTPSGLIVTVDSNTGKWESVLLAQNLPGEQMKFTNPCDKLHEALQTNQLFLVASANTYLKGFDNVISIEEWKFKMNVGVGNEYGNYKNLMLFKFCKGTLSELVKKTQGWTLGGDFNNPDEMVVISQWLQNYMNDGINQSTNGNTLFDKFKTIVTDPNWNGILFCKADIASIPAQMSGMTAGMDIDNFYVHHLGIEISLIDGAEIQQNGPSSMFGLINYINPQYEQDKENTPVPPATEDNYEFKVLLLNVLFENTTVKHFESKAQLTLNNLFNLAVDHMGDPNNPYNTIMLNGSIQNRKDNAGNEQTIYMLDTTNDNIFYFTSQALRRIEIVKVQFNTLGLSDNGNDPENVLSRFDLWGFMDFGILSGEVDLPQGNGNTQTAFKVFDYFSFGNNYSVNYTDKTITFENLPRQGLRFSGLGINMKYPKDKPLECTFSFDPSKITFDLNQSTIRDQINASVSSKGIMNPVVSLYDNLCLEIEGLLCGDDKTTPAENGFLQIGTELRLTGVSGKWTGIQCKISMGTIGELAGKAKLVSHLLFAWNADDCNNPNQIFVGIKLPGSGAEARLFSLQGVLKLSVSDILLNYVEGKSSYLLSFTDIALKFLGMLKLPPNGSTSFYLFGNPEPGSKAGDLGWYAVYNQEKKQINSL